MVNAKLRRLLFHQAVGTREGGRITSASVFFRRKLGRYSFLKGSESIRSRSSLSRGRSSNSPSTKIDRPPKPGLVLAPVFQTRVRLAFLFVFIPRTLRIHGSVRNLLKCRTLNPIKALSATSSPRPADIGRLLKLSECIPSLLARV